MVTWTFFGVTVLVPNAGWVCDLFAPSATTSPLGLVVNVISWVVPNIIGVCPDSLATDDPVWTLLHSPEAKWFGSDSPLVARVAMVGSPKSQPRVRRVR